jgi:hypothetical protein
LADSLLQRKGIGINLRSIEQVFIHFYDKMKHLYPKIYAWTISSSIGLYFVSYLLSGAVPLFL